MQLNNGLMVKCDAVLQRNGTVKDTKVAWALARNRAKIEQPLEDLKQQIEPTAAMKAFKEARDKLIEQHAVRTAAGMPKRTPIPDQPGSFRYQIADAEALEAAVEAWRKEHPEVEADEQMLTKREEELLKLTTDFEPYKLKVSDVLSGTLDSESMFVLFQCGILEE